MSKRAVLGAMRAGLLAMKKERRLEQQRRDAAAAELEGFTPATELAGSAAPEQGAALLERQQRFERVLEQIGDENPLRWLTRRNKPPAEGDPPRSHLLHITRKSAQIVP